MVVVKRFTFGPFAENTYVVWDQETKETAIVDPGCIVEREQDKLLSFLDEHDLFLKYLIITHGHIDHIAGCAFIKDKFNPPFYAPMDDIELLGSFQEQGEAFGVVIQRPPYPDESIDLKKRLSLGKSYMNFLYTPGHTPGEYCIYFPNEQFCLTGDVLFKGSIGRTDLWGSDYEKLMDSINNKLLTLPDEVVIYPGHGESSKIGIEKRDNQFLNLM